MKRQNITKGVAGVLATFLILPIGLPAFAADPAASTAVMASSENSVLTEKIRAVIKNASVVQTENGSRISVSLRLYNGGGASIRVPEHELRVRTQSGLTYTLPASAANKEAMQPKEVVELVYSAFVDAKDIGSLRQIDFVHLNLYVYPKVEETLFSLPAEAVWYGLGETTPAKPEQIGWNQPFRIPGINSGIVYTPMNASIQSTSTGKTAVVTLLATNPGVGRETIPSFRIDGVEGQKTYSGQLSSAASKELEVGEKVYLQYVIPLEQGVTLSGLLVQTMDSFVERNGSVTISTGKATLPWPTTGATDTPVTSYELGQPIAIDSLTKIVDARTEIALMEFDIHENAEEGHKTAIAKFKLTNRSNVPVGTPMFGTEIMNGQGISYMGSRQKTADLLINPGLSYVVSYSYDLPRNDATGRYTMKLFGLTSAGLYSSPVSAIHVQKQETKAGAAFSLYPFTVKVNDVRVGYLYTADTGLYQFKISLDMDINQLDDVVVDSGFSMVRFEVVDPLGRIIGSQDAALTGPKKLISGKQVLEANNLTSDQFTFPLTVNIYEVIETETGTAKRFLKRVK
jgi:hypothetical protein